MNATKEDRRLARALGIALAASAGARADADDGLIKLAPLALHHLIREAICAAVREVLATGPSPSPVSVDGVAEMVSARAVSRMKRNWTDRTPRARCAGRAVAKGDAMSAQRRPFRMLLERDVAEIERRLRLYRENAPKRIAEELGVHINTVCTVNLGRHPVQARLRG